MNDNSNPIVRLLQSSKAIVVLAVTLATFVGVYRGSILWRDANDFLKWVLGPWLLAQGAVDVAKQLTSTAVIPDTTAETPTVPSPLAKTSKGD